MAKKIIILDTQLLPDATRTVRAVFWYPVTVGDEVLQPGAQSAFKNAIAGETTALQTGTVVEESYTGNFPAGTNKAAVQAALQSAYASALAVWQGRNKPNQFFGTFWDGTTWT